jgi:hypothetical protein
MVRRLAAALALLAAGAGAATLLGIGSAGAAPAPTVQNVREQNLDSQGNIKVHEQGIPSVSLTGDPRVGLDPILGNTVKIDTNANTVKIDPTAGAVPTMAADNPAFTPVKATAGTFFVGGGAIVYTVPAHEELVIEEVSANVGSDHGTPDPLVIFKESTRSGGPFLSFSLPLTPLVAQGEQLAAAMTETRIYADPGTDVVCQFFGFGGEGGGGRCDISGYLVPVK